MDYIRNSKNRKLKTRILALLSRLNFGTSRLGIAGKSIILLNGIIVGSLFFPWITLHLSSTVTSYNAFSLYTGYAGYGTLIAVGIMLFFLMSHTKKERIRAYVPFRLSDAQAIVFVNAILLTSHIHLLIMTRTYAEQFALYGVEIHMGYIVALSASLLLLIATYYFSQDEKTAYVSMSYLDKKEGEYMSEYAHLLESDDRPHSSHTEDKNMTLPI